MGSHADAMPPLPQLPYRDFCLIRHGETTANRDGKIAGRTDVALTETGRQQARALAQFPWPEQKRVFTSALSRAIETASLAFPQETLTQLPELNERDWGIFENRPLEELPPRDSPPPQGESWADMIHRVQRALWQCDAAAGAALPILVCHSGVIRATRLLCGHHDLANGTRPPNATPLFFHWTGSQHEEHHAPTYITPST